MNFSRSKFIALFGSVATAVVLLITSPALAASSHAASATRSARIKTELRAEIKAQLRYNPAGKVIGARQISYAHGQVIVTVANPSGSTPDFRCPGGYVCLFQSPNLKGNNAAIKYPLDTNIIITGYLPYVESLQNLRSTASILSNGNGRTVCYPGGQVANNISAPVKYYPYLYLDRSSNC